VVRRYWSSLALIVIGAVWLLGGALAALTGRDGPQSPVLVLALGGAAVLAGVASAVVRARSRDDA
jgi:drug/metabolite transporter (DMT)-like permease